MYTLAMNNDMGKKERAVNAKQGARFGRVRGLLLIAVACIAVDHIYALFGHGVRSDAMTYMFLYPLGAAALYTALGITRPKAATSWWGRLGGNLVGSGVATLTAGSFLAGILEIAGSSSVYVPAFAVAGWAFAAVGVIGLLIAALRADP